MATTTAKNLAKPMLPGLLAQGVNAAVGFCWGGVMLLIMALWLRSLSDNLGLWFVFAVAILGVAFLAIGIVQLLWQRRRTKGIDRGGEELVPVLAQRQSKLAVAMWLGALASLGLAAYIASIEGKSAIGQVSGLIVLGLIAIAGALSLRSAGGEGNVQDRFFTWMKNNRQAVRVIFIGLAIIMAVVAAGLILRVGATVLPEIVLCVLLALVFAGAGMFVLVATEKEFRKQNLRILVLTAGGLTGFFLWLAVIWRIVLWWGSLFGAGLSAWYGPESWKIWVCFYVQAAALGILFGSVMLGQADMRSNVALRRLLYGYNAAVAGLVLLEFLIVLNVVVYVSYPGNLQWTKSRGLHSLSEKSKSLLASLPEPVRVYVIMSQGHEFHFDTRALLENCQVYARNFKVEEVSPERDPMRYRELAHKYPRLFEAKQIRLDNEDDLGRGLLIVFGEETADKKLPHTFIDQNDLGKGSMDHGDPEGRRVIAYKGEDVIMSQINMLKNSQKKPKIYFTQGNGELDVNDASLLIDPANPRFRNVDGCGKLVERLKQDNYDVRSLVWGRPVKGQGNLGDLVVFSKKTPEDTHEVPADAEVVFIADPQMPFAPDVLEALERYMDRKGKLVVLTNVPSFRASAIIDTNLEGFLKKYNVLMEKDFLMHFREQAGRESYNEIFNILAVTPEQTSNPIAKSFRTSTFLLEYPRTVKPGLETANYRAEVLLEARAKENGYFWAEKDFKVLRSDPRFYVRDLVVGGKIQEKSSTTPLSVAVGVLDRDNKPRMVIIGDGRFANNLYVGRNQPYYDFLTSSMEWLAESPGNIGIGPKETGTFMLRETEINYSRLVWLPLALICLGVVALGSGIWVVRRR